MKTSEIMNLRRDVDTFTRAYIEAALWSSTDENGDPLDDNYNWTHISEQSLEKMISDCAKFQEQNRDFIGGADKLAGHDFWLTRNHHGSGFWDGDWPDQVEDTLTNAAHAFSECNLYVGDDGKLHL